MKKIYKYELPYIGGQVKRIEAKVIEWLDIKSQNGIPHIWAIVEVDAEELDAYEIAAWGTGWEVPEEFSNYAYMGTAIDEWDYVWHYFMRQVRPVKIEAIVEQIRTEDWLAHKIEIDGLYTEERDWTTKISCTIE